MLNLFARALLLALSACSIASAQTTLDTLVVTGNRTDTPVFRLSDTISVIDRELIEASQASSLAELLASRAGLEVLDYYGDGSRANVGLRGFGENAASNALVLVDGQMLNNPDIGNPDLGRIRLEDIERIEILDGGTALWGNQAVGGVIHIVTRTSKPDQLSVDFGSFNAVDVRAQSGLSGETWRIGLAGSHRESDNYRRNNALERQSAAIDARLEGSLAQAWLRLEHSDEFLRTPGGLFADEVAADRRQSAADFAGDFSSLRSLNANAGFSADIGHDTRFDARIGRYASDGRFKLSFRGFAADPASQDRLLLSFNPQWTHRFSLREEAGHLALGADLQRADYRLQSQFGIQRNEQKVNDLYLTSLLPLHARLDLNASLRHSVIRDEIADPGPFATLPEGKTYRHEETLGSLGLNLRLNQQLSLFAGGDQVLRYPKVDEYFGSGFTADTIGLLPQTGDNLELGARFAARTVQGSLMLYRLVLDNEIVYDPTSFTNTNLDRTRRHGLTAQTRISPDPRWSLDLSYSRINARIRGADRIPLVARQHGQASLNLQLHNDIKLQAQLRASGDRLAGGDNDGSARRLPGFAILNLAARYRQGPLQLGLKLANVLDKHYSAVGFEDGTSGEVAEFPLPGFNAQLSFAYDFH